MSKMGKWLLIFGIAALVSIIAFALTVAALGVKDNNYSVSIGDVELPFTDGGVIHLGGVNNMGKSEILFINNGTNYHFDFERNNDYNIDFDPTELSDIKISLLSCRADVKCTDTDRVKLSYRSGNRPLRFVAEMKDGVLDISENLTVSLFSFGSYQNSEMILELPESVYSLLDLNLASGTIAANGIKTDKLNANLASGNLDLTLYAESIKINTASGKAFVTNLTDEPAGNIDVDVASGTVEIRGFGADNTTASLASGKVYIDTLTGKVKGEVMSGTLTLVYSEWNDDLKLNLASGKVDVTLPEGSGANIDYEHMSGKTEIDLDGRSATLSKNASITAGGSNVHNVSIETASGTVKIHN